MLALKKQPGAGEKVQLAFGKREGTSKKEGNTSISIPALTHIQHHS
jgi:hypothetical protein